MNQYGKVFNIKICPFCGSSRVKVTSTVRPRRRLKCAICLRTWKTIEVVEIDGWLPRVLKILIREGRLDEFDYTTREAIIDISRKSNISVF